ncbi:hypothetical protein BCR35DRAFT_7717 [Leucosporidium creatinivorum]|uniref:Uncharacterized protein n=1 Tax=Leucosporidium creatinivorum TaxID=106004 RepID=A0A1Y2G877_9BASI|nr:hypothetical protein BCR35DRAFT_7717 [Leucosporidium creatinivorum]
MKRVRLIWLDYIPGVMLWDLLAAPALLTLILRGGTLHAPPPPSDSSLQPSPIRRLALCNNPYIEQPAHIPPRLFPNLHSLSIAYTGARSHRLYLSCSSVCKLTSALGPQLTSLRVNLGGLQAVQKALPHLTSLRMLGAPIESEESLLKMLEALPRPLVGLYGSVAKPTRTTDDWHTTAYIFSQLFKADPLPSCFQDLKFLFVHGWPDAKDALHKDLDYRIAYRGWKKDVLVSRLCAEERPGWEGPKEEDILPWRFWWEVERLEELEKLGRSFARQGDGLYSKNVDN